MSDSFGVRDGTSRGIRTLSRRKEKTVKLQIVKEFSQMLLREQYYVWVGGGLVRGYDTQVEAEEHCKKIIEKKFAKEVVASYEVPDELPPSESPQFATKNMNYPHPRHNPEGYGQVMKESE